MRVCAYTRVSSEEQAQHGYSLDAQRKAIEHYASSRGWTISKEFCDAGVSAFTDDPRKRPAFAALLADVAARRWDALIVLKLDRFARSVRVSAEMLGYFRDHRCALVSVAEGYDFGSVSGQFMYHILGALAEMESRQTSERVRRAIAERRAQGRYQGTTPWGALLIDGRLVLDPARAETVAWILARLATDSLGTVATALNARGVRTKRGGYWNWTALDTWLRAADWLLALDDPWPGRVTLARARPASPRVRDNMRTFPLTGLLRCVCGGTIGARGADYTRRDGVTMRYLRCLHRTPDRPTGGGCGRRLRARHHYDAIARAWVLALPDITAQLAAPLSDSGPQRAALLRRRRLLGTALSDETIAEADYRQRLAALKREEAALGAPARRATLLAPLLVLRQAFGGALPVALTPEAENAALRLLIARCIIDGPTMTILPSETLAHALAHPEDHPG